MRWRFIYHISYDMCNSLISKLRILVLKDINEILKLNFQDRGDTADDI